jgi:peptidyl-prolyl cis-trans isomerase NIMA-interacting 1
LDFSRDIQLLINIAFIFQSKIKDSHSIIPTTMSDQVRASHILKKHAGSRRPASWRCPNVTQSKDEAIAQIQAIIAQLKACGSQEEMFKLFGTIASTESDCGSAQAGGDLGAFGRGAMQKAFEDATFATRVGELSGIVDSDSGIHVILRTA